MWTQRFPGLAVQDTLQKGNFPSWKEIKKSLNQVKNSVVSRMQKLLTVREHNRQLHNGYLPQVSIFFNDDIHYIEHLVSVTPLLAFRSLLL